MEPATIESLLSLASTYLKQEKNIKLIEDAYNLAKQQHEGQFRMSGEPYIKHPLAVAYMLT